MTIVGVLVALGLTLVLHPVAPHFLFLFFLWVVVWSALYGGFRLALLAIALSAIVAGYLIFLLEIRFSTPTGHFVSLGLFVITALLLTAALEIRSRQVVRRQRALEESEARFKGIVTSASDAIISTGSDQRIILFNAAAEQMFKCTAAEAVGQSLDRFIPERFRDRHREHVRRFGETGVSGHAMNGERVVTGLRADGDEFPAEAQISQLTVASQPQYTVILRDITQRRVMDTALRESEALERRHRTELETLIEAIPAPVWIASDPECLHMTGNRAARDLLGAAAGQNLSRSAPEGERPRFEVRADGVVVPPEQLPMQKAAATGKPVFGSEFEIVLPDSPSRFLFGNAVPLMNEKGAVRGCVGVFVDVTERRQAAAALKEAAQRKDEFLAMLAHELRNPLAPIRNAVHLLRLLGPAEPRLMEARDLIDRQVTHMVRLIDDLLDVSRITRGAILLRKERVALEAIVEQAVETVRPTIVQKRHALTLSCTPEPITVEADPARLTQVIANLLSNAAKFTEPGGTITLTTERSGEHAVIQVRDTGVGIAPDLLPRIFDLFVQGEVSLDRTEGGLGIGLTLVRHLVEQHGGHVEARSAGRGCGSEFIVTWPALGSPVVRPATTSDVLSLDGFEHPLRVMVVEDNVDAAESFNMLLELQGHEVRAAHTGRAALDLAETFVPDVAFVDIGLPGLDGYEVARRFRAMPAFQATVLVALSGYGRDEDKCRAQDAGFDHHLTKPVELSTIDRLLNDIAGRFTELQAAAVASGKGSSLP